MFRKLGEKVFEMRSNHLVRVIGKFVSREFRCNSLCCPGDLRIKRIDALVERFVVGGNVDIFGKASNGTTDPGKRCAP